MPTISLEYESLKKLIPNISKEDISSALRSMGIDVSVTDNGTLNMEILPNRPDLYSVEGIARALTYFLGERKDFNEYSLDVSDVKIDVLDSVKSVRPYISSAIITDIEIDDYTILSLMNLQEKLHQTLGRNRKKVAIGVHDFDKLTPPFIYKAVEPDSIKFIPLNDNEERTLSEILTNHEKGILYGDIVKPYSKYPIIIDGNNNVVSFPPVINASLTTVTENTNNLFIECTGTDMKTINDTINILVTAIHEHKGKIKTVEINDSGRIYKTPEIKTKLKIVSVDYINGLLGTNFTEKYIVYYLARMGIYAKHCNGKIHAEIPPYRIDILHPVDIVEEVAIGYGYRHFEGILPEKTTFGMRREIELFSDNIRLHLSGMGFQEIYTLVLSNETIQFKKMQLTEKDNCTYIMNPITEEYTLLRHSLLPGLLNFGKINKHKELPQKIFEIGDVIQNNRNLRKIAGIIIAYDTNFTEIKSVVETLLMVLGVRYKLRGEDKKPFISGRCSAIIRDNESIGYFGELHPKIIEEFDLQCAVTGFEMDIPI